jgi:hypothetical protein
VSEAALRFSRRARRARLAISARRWAPFAVELTIVAAGALAYFLIRGTVKGRASEALDRAADLVAIERQLGVYWEPAMQAWILESRALIEFFNAVYFWTHMPVIITVAVWLHWRHRRIYGFTRNAFVGSAVIGLAIYYALPTAPPRLLPEAGLVDTMALYSQTSYQAQEVGPFVNAYAALPSLHFGWALLIAMALWLARPSTRWGATVFAALGLLLVFGQLIGIVVTGNHFLLDALAGAVVAAVGVLVAFVWRRYRGLAPSTAATER